MITHTRLTKRLAAFAFRAAALTLVSGLAACADDAAPTRPMEPTTANFGKNVTGANQRLLYTSDETGDFEIYSMNPDGTAQTRLTNSPKIDIGAVWSPDGKRIAFTSSRDNPAGDIYVMNADGTGVTRLTITNGLSTDPSWSKDGKQIVFTSTRASAQSPSVNVADYEIFVMNADGTGVTRLTYNSVIDVAPMWSPDGQRIAFISGRDHVGYTTTDLYTMNPDGTQVTRMTAQNSELSYPSWEPHSRSIAFSIAYGATPGVYVLDVSTLALHRLTFNGPYVDWYGSWSPDGTKLAFTSYRDGTPEIYSMNADGSGATRLTTNMAQEIYVRWSR